jgi:hypothetical protein
MIKWALRITVLGIVVTFVSPDPYIIPKLIWGLDSAFGLIISGVSGQFKAYMAKRLVHGLKYSVTEGWKHPMEHTLGWTVIDIIKGWF